LEETERAWCMCVQERKEVLGPGVRGEVSVVSWVVLLAEDMEVVETAETEGLDKMVLDILMLYLRQAVWIQQVNGACSLPHSLATP